MVFREIVAPTVKELFVQQLEGMILSGELRPGDRLPTERELADEMKISKTVVHEGLRELHRLGFLDIASRRGVTVADYAQTGSLETLRAIMDFHGGIPDRKTALSILRLRYYLEAPAMEELAARHTAADMAALRGPAAAGGGGLRPEHRGLRAGAVPLPPGRHVPQRQHHHAADLQRLHHGESGLLAEVYRIGGYGPMSGNAGALHGLHRRRGGRGGGGAAAHRHPALLRLCGVKKADKSGLTKECDDMKKTMGLIALLILMMGLVGCSGETVNIDFPFEVGDVENIEVYRYAGVPVSAEKKVVVAATDIANLYDRFEDLSLKEKQVEETTGADVTSFRFNLSDGTNYELIYVCNGVKNGKLKSFTGNFEYFTSSDIGSYWSDIDLEAVPAEESELPKQPD